MIRAGEHAPLAREVLGTGAARGTAHPFEAAGVPLNPRTIGFLSGDLFGSGGFLGFLVRDEEKYAAFEAFTGFAALVLDCVDDGLALRTDDLDLGRAGVRRRSGRLGVLFFSNEFLGLASFSHLALAFLAIAAFSHPPAVFLFATDG